MSERAESSASTRFNKWEGITATKPVFCEQHLKTVVVYLKLCEYDRWAVENSSKAISMLHRFHLLLDDQVKAYNLYKTETRGGEFSITSQVPSNSDDFESRVLNFCLALLYKAKTFVNPFEGKLGVNLKIAISSGEAYAAILGRSGVRYGMYGEADVIAHNLLEYAQENVVIASQSFYTRLKTETHAWTAMSNIQVFSEKLGKEQIFVTPYIFNGAKSTENNCINSRQVADSEAKSQMETGNIDRNLLEQRNEGPSHFSFYLKKFGLSLCFEDQVAERNFRLFQADRMYFIDALYLVVSLVVIQTIFMRSLSRGIPSPFSFGLLMLAMIGTMVPLFGMIFCKSYYTEHRHFFMISFRFIRILALVFHNVVAPAIMLEMPNSPFVNRILVSNSCLIHGMHAIGAQIFVIIAVTVHNWLACTKLKSNMHNIECSSLVALIFSNLIQLLCMFALPTFLVYRIETMQRKAFLASSKHLLKKQD